MSLRLITAPASYPVTLAEVKAQCRIDGSDEDTYLNSLIAAATDYVQQYTGLALVSQTWELVLDDWVAAILIPKGPATGITSVKYIDTAGAEQTVSSTNYAFDSAGDPQWLVKAADYTWPDLANGVNSVVIRFVCGFATIPPSIKHAMLLLIGDWYRGRENSALGSNQPSEMPHAVAALLSNYRSFSF